LQFAQANAQTKNCKRACFANADKIVFKNFQTLQKKIHHHTARHTQQIMTRKLNINKAYSDTVDRRPAGNSTYKKLAVQWLNEALCFVSSSVVAESSELRNRQLLVAAKR
jgi:cation transport regulator ChaB